MKSNSRNSNLLEALKNFQLDSEEEENEGVQSNQSEEDESALLSDENKQNSVQSSENSGIKNRNNPFLFRKYDENAKNANETFGKTKAVLPIKRNIKTNNSTANFQQEKPKAPQNVENKSSIQKNNLERPKTSYKGKENVRFQPVYTEAYNQFLITNKCFNYKDKKFITVAKKTDIVAKYQNLRKGWEKTKFLKNNNLQGKEGRKLNLAERINNDKPEEMFYRYVPKAGLY